VAVDMWKTHLITIHLITHTHCLLLCGYMTEYNQQDSSS